MNIIFLRYIELYEIRIYFTRGIFPKFFFTENSSKDSLLLKNIPNNIESKMQTHVEINKDFSILRLEFPLISLKTNLSNLK